MAEVHFYAGPFDGETCCVTNPWRPIIAAPVDPPRLTVQKSFGGAPLAAPEERQPCRYIPVEFGQSCFGYFCRSIWVAFPEGVDPDQPWASQPYEEKLRMQPWRVRQEPKGSEDFDAWWAMQMLRLGRSELDRLASRWHQHLQPAGLAT